MHTSDLSVKIWDFMHQKWLVASRGCSYSGVSRNKKCCIHCHAKGLCRIKTNLKGVDHILRGPGQAPPRLTLWRVSHEGAQQYMGTMIQKWTTKDPQVSSFPGKQYFVHQVSMILGNPKWACPKLVHSAPNHCLCTSSRPVVHGFWVDHNWTLPNLYYLGTLKIGWSLVKMMKHI